MAIKNIKEISSLNIWDHQKDALTQIGVYLSKSTDKSFLVKMPTGTGKTGVFSVLTRISNPDDNYLIITPSSALKFQIIEEVKEKFWDKIGYDKSKLKNQIIAPILPTDFEKTLKDIGTQKFIIVTTIQALQSVANKSELESEYIAFQKKVNCIIFDEGHKEPAYTWGETVRSFKKPTILFSATPYRNDYKIFNVDKENFYSLEHNFCVSKNILRSIEINEIRENPNTVAMFLKKLLTEIEKIKPILISQGIKNPKTIIRCENSSDIEKIVNALIKAKIKVIGIHENFNQSNNLSSNVPDSNDQNKYDFFVHQYKLIEGIDNSDFCIVAIYSDFKSTRLLIQQVGRILRNPALKPNQKAFLFCINKIKIQNEWAKYLKYDSELDKRTKLFDITDILKVNKEVSTLYFSGTFRDLVNVNTIVLKDSLLFQKKINVYYHDGTVSFKELSHQLLEEWNSRDYHVLKNQFIGNDTLLILYIKYENSPLVKDGVFIEQTLAMTFLKFKKTNIFFYDSIQSSPLRQLEDLRPVQREELIKLFKDKRYINKIFLMNTDIGANNVRNKELQAGAVENTAPGLADHTYFPARIEGNVLHKGESLKRYIGFQNGRITDFSNARLKYSEFEDWINEIHTGLNTIISSNSISNLLNRYSQKVNAPTNPIPASILLDIDNSLLSNYGYGDGNDNVELMDYCANVEKNSFQININQEDFNIDIQYDLKYEKFVLTCPQLNEKVNSLNENDISLLTYLNSNQSFRVVVQGNQYVYAHKNFFKPSINLISKKKDLDINQLFNLHKCINVIESEKGDSVKTISNNLWHPKTLFGLIARQGKGYGDSSLEQKFDFEHLLCDDLSSEIADFIGLDTKSKRVVFIHAKAKKSKLSATNFTEVCGQATKNLDYLTPYFYRTPSNNINKWKSPWSLDGVGKINDRVLVGGLSSKQFWDTFIKLISDPSTSREVWLVVGNMFDYRVFSSELNKNDITKVKPEVIQLIYLLRSTWNNVSSVGGNLKIFC